MPVKTRGEWFESFFGETYGKVLAASFPPERTLAQARLVRRLLRLHKGETVLDIPCGQGRLTLPLAEVGLKMTGVDFNAAYLRFARSAAKTAGLAARFVRCDMRRIEFDGEFDAAFNYFTSIGYFDDEGDLAFCRAVCRALRPGGRFLVETLHRTWILKRFLDRASERVGDVEIFHRNRWDAASRRTEDVWTFRHGRKMERHRVSIHLYDGPELRRLLERAGFESVRLYGWPPLSRLTRASRRLIAVARRPA
jgi:SAM-dependent methyltransferase